MNCQTCTRNTGQIPLSLASPVLPLKGVFICQSTGTKLLVRICTKYRELYKEKTLLRKNLRQIRDLPLVMEAPRWTFLVRIAATTIARTRLTAAMVIGFFMVYLTVVRSINTDEVLVQIRNGSLRGWRRTEEYNIGPGRTHIWLPICFL